MAAVIEVRDLTFSYGGPPVLESVNLVIKPREFACLVGPNGGGKTTLIRLLLGLLVPQRGTVHIFGLPPAEARQRIGYMPQHTQLDPQFPVSVMDVALMGRTGCGGSWGRYTRADRATVRQSLADVGMADLWRQPFAALSGGQRQRVLLARALACQPELLLLDEPTSNLDLMAQQDLHQLLHELNARLTIVLVSHDFGFVSHFATTVVCVKRTLAVHPTSDVNAELISQVYGREVRMVRHEHAYEGIGHR